MLLYYNNLTLEVSNEDTSSSSEISIAEIKKPPVMPSLRKPKSKSQVFTKRPQKNNGGYSSHNDDISFRYLLN